MVTYSLLLKIIRWSSVFSRFQLSVMYYSVIMKLVLLWWQEFATWSVAVFFLTCYRGGGAGGKYWSLGRCQG